MYVAMTEAIVISGSSVGTSITQQNSRRNVNHGLGNVNSQTRKCNQFLDLFAFRGVGSHFLV